MYNTIIVNLFAGPGCGKSTGANKICYELKSRGIDCEVVTEVAKDFVWENNLEALSDQLYVFGEQCHRVNRLLGKVQVIVTDSPSILSVIYNKDKKIDKNLFNKFALSYYNNYNNINYLLTRIKPYNPNGRLQSKTQAMILDVQIKELLDNNFLEYRQVEGSEEGYNQIVEDVIKIINN